MASIPQSPIGSSLTGPATQISPPFRLYNSNQTSGLQHHVMTHGSDIVCLFSCTSSNNNDSIGLDEW